MPRTSNIGRRGFIWNFPRTDPATHKIYVNGDSSTGDDVTIDVFESTFTKSLCPETGEFTIKLINSDEAYTGKYSQNQEVNMYIDLASGTTLRFKGIIDTIKNEYDGGMGFMLTLSGGHLTKRMFEVLVTESYNGTMTVDAILKDIIDTYLSGYTYTNVSTSTVKPTLKWDNKPLWDCVNDLCNLIGFDSYIDDSYDFHFFEKDSIENNDEAVVWNDTMINTDGLGEQTITTKNKVTVIGDDGEGIPVLYTSEDTTSQSDYGTRELAVFDTNIKNVDSAQEVADAQITQSANPDTEGDVEALILPSLKPGDKIWITNPPMQINGQYRIYSFTHKLPNEFTSLTVNQERTSKQLFKKRIENELASQTIKNPYKMKYSINLTFDSADELTSADSNISLVGGKLALTSGSQAVFTKSFTASSAVTEVHLRVIGFDIKNTDFEFSTDGGDTYEDLALESKTVLDNSGTDCILKVTIQSATTEMDSLGLMYK